MEEFRFDDWDFPRNIDNRGVQNLPNYHFRDDGLRLWNIMHEYVESMVNIFYDSDDDVREDSELEEWFSEIYQ